MGKLPSPKKVRSGSKTQREYLRKWLEMRQFDYLWDAGFDEDGEISKEGHEAPVGFNIELENEASCDKNVAPSQIRLFDPTLLPSASIPRYFAVIDEWDDGLLLLLPFAPYSVPAVTGEFVTGRDHFSLAVLEAWNAVVAPPEVISRSWLVDGMSSEEVADALAVFRYIASGTPLPERLDSRIGAPILVRDDPRIVYQSEETAVFASLREAAVSFIDKVPQAVPEAADVASIHLVDFRRELGLPDSMAMAASSLDPERPLRRCLLRSDSPEVEIAVSECVSPQHLALRVLSDPGNVVPGAVVTDKAGNSLGVISEEGILRIVRPASLKIAIQITSGEFLVLRKIEG